MKENGSNHSTRHLRSPPTPERVQPTNPVPAFIARTVPNAKMNKDSTVYLDLMKTKDIKMWDGKELEFFLVGCPDIPSSKRRNFSRCNNPSSPWCYFSRICHWTWADTPYDSLARHRAFCHE